MSYSDPSWMDDGLCAQVGGDTWFPDKGESTQEAKAVCNGRTRHGRPELPPCPVRELCLEYALERHERYGVYGGKSERERRAILAEREAAP